MGLDLDIKYRLAEERLPAAARADGLIADAGIGKINKLFPAIITIRRMLQSDERWSDFATEFEALMDEYSDVVQLSFIGFPPEWKKILLK